MSATFFEGTRFLPLPAAAPAYAVAAGFTSSALEPTMLEVTTDRYPKGGTSLIFGALAARVMPRGIFMPWAVGWMADRSDLHWEVSLSALAPLFILSLVLGLPVHARPGAGKG